MQLAKPIINTPLVLKVYTGGKRAIIKPTRKTYETLGGAKLTHKSGVDAERMLQLESTIRQIDSWVLLHNPETYVLHDQL